MEARKRPNGLFKGQTLFMVLPFLSHKRHLHYKVIKNIFCEIRIQSCLIFYWIFDFSWRFMVCEIAHLGTMLSKFACWSIGSFLHEGFSHSLLPVLTIRIIRALPLRRNYRISIAEMQTRLQAPSLFSARVAKPAFYEPHIVKPKLQRTAT